MVVLHYTAMQNAAVALARLCDPSAEVSAHYLIARDGEVFGLVDEEMRAWHAGAGRWGGVDDINSRSIGIELDNTGAQPFPEPQMAALEDLLTGVLARWAIP
ncbi:MAG: N-acetylmuramoyl-L-alanine amidase, partial [Rhodobacter sp.]|nr:N-acetylmuramoyl-L-alanine amidase [Rhodobacter sp.]